MIKVKIPQLLQEHNMNATDLMRKGEIAYATALRLSKGEGTGISFDVLNNICKLFNVGVDAVLEYVPDDNNINS